MHVFQPKHSKMKREEVDDLLKKFNISLSQLPKISVKDPLLPEGCEVGDVVKIERVVDDGIQEYFRVVVL